MTLQYTTVDERAFSYGIDARSAENQVREGFVRDLVNGDIIEGRFRKRKGSASYAGNIPVRVISLRYESPHKVCFTLDGSIDLSRVENTPIIGYGKSTQAPFPSTGGLRYFTSWTTSLRKTLLASTTGTITATAAEHNIPTSDMFVGLAESTGLTDTDLSGSLIKATGISIDTSSFDISVDYTNGNSSNKSAFIYYLNQTPITGSVFVKTSSLSLGTNNITINATGIGGHGLTNYLIVPQLYVKGTSTPWQQVLPNNFTVNRTNGQVDFSLEIDDATINQYKIILSVVAPAQTVSFSLNTGLNSFIVPDVGSPFLFPALYTLSGSTLTLIQPEEYDYNDTTKALTVNYNNLDGASTGVLYYSYGAARTNELCVTVPETVTSTTDTSPQLSLYGLDHNIIYGDEKDILRRGWVNHIDSYRSPSATHLVAGLGGNLFAALTASEMVGGDGLPLLFQSSMPTYYARLQGRLNAATNIGPAFYDNTAIPSRTRGSVAFNSGGTNWATITKVEYQTSSGWTRYTMSTPGMVVTGSPISTTLGLEDYLTVKGMSHSKHEGNFLIKSVSYGTDEVIVEVVNTELDSTDYDDTGCFGLGGVFTDQVTLATPSEFIADDQLLSSSWGNETELRVIKSSSATVLVQNVFDYKELAAGLLISGSRTSNILPLRNQLGTAVSDYLVVGDVLSTPLVQYPLVVTAVNSQTNSVTVDNAFTWYDDTTNVISYTVSRRWVSREMPVKDTGDNLINDKISRYFANNDYDNQPFLRSVMVQNNMYFTNGDDEVYKYDGSNIYRAGIIPWQPGLFLTVTTGTGLSLQGLAASASIVGAGIEISKGDATQFPEGTIVKYTDTNNPGGVILTVKSNTEASSSNHTLTFTDPLSIISGGTNKTLSLVYQARYYFRLNLKDRNGVTVASAVTGAEDFVVNLAPPSTATLYSVNLRLVGLPAWDHYDYSNKNIELKVYRTFWSEAPKEVPVFYEIATKQVPYKGIDGYIDFTDTLGNDTLVDGDSVVGVLSPNTTPAGWEDPPRAKYLTSAGNRLVLGNITDWPTLAINYLTSGSVPYTSYNGQKFLFRRDGTNSGTVSNMTDRVTYELISTPGKPTSWSTPVSGTSFSFTCTPPRALAANDWVYLYFGTSNVGAPTYSGWWQIETPVVHSTTTTGTGTTTSTVNVVDTTGFPASGVVSINGTSYGYTGITPTSLTGVSPTLSYTAGQTVTNTTVTVNTPLAGGLPAITPYAMFASTAGDVPVNIDGDFNMGMLNGDTVNFLTPANRILRRVGMAINATMRMCKLSGFVPWLVARSESDIAGLTVKQPRAEDQLPSVQITGGSTAYQTYVNGARSNGTPIDATITRYPSRILVSYNNYPEIFDNPFTVNDDLSASAIDINSSDGQEITGVIPFFGESAFGAALQGGVIVVFKQNSIYLVNLDYKREGKNPVERLETQGIGCTAPYSIASTRDGIAFANDSGIYVLRRSQRVEYLGKYMERKWQKEVNTSYLNIMQGHHYNVGRQYKLSVPVVENGTSSYAENSEVYVYNHTNEGTDEPGGWARYTNHPATGWANLFQDAFYANVNGSVMRLRAEEIPEDYRDGSDAIEAILESRATDFGQAGIRKVVSHVILNYRTGGTSEHTTVEAAPDLMQEFDETTPFTVVNVPMMDGFSSTSGQDIVSIRHSIAKRRCIYMTIRISNNGLDEDLEIAGMSFVVSGLNSKGILQAANTKK